MESYEARVDHTWDELTWAGLECLAAHGYSEMAVARSYDSTVAKMGHVPLKRSAARREVRGHVERALGFDVVFGPGPLGILAAHPSVSGYCDFTTRTIAIKPQACKTLDTYVGQRLVMHECGHALMHSEVEWDYGWLDERKMEWEAELFASIVTPESKAQSMLYLAQWYAVTASPNEVSTVKENVTKALWTIGRRQA